MKTPQFYLEHIHEQAVYLIEASRDMSKQDFLQNHTLILAFERSLEIIGEAVGRLDDKFKEAHPEIPWRNIRGLRNIVAHVYWEVDYDIIWQVVTVEIPTLKGARKTYCSAHYPAMNKQQIIFRIQQHEVPLRCLGVRSLTLFGSWARGKQRTGSDIDLLYEFRGGAGHARASDGPARALRRNLGMPCGSRPRQAHQPHPGSAHR